MALSAIIFPQFHELLKEQKKSKKIPHMSF